MKTSITHRLEFLSERHEEIRALLTDPIVIQDQNRFRALSREYAALTPLVEQFNAYQILQQSLSATAELLKTEDMELKVLVEEELKIEESKQVELEHALQLLLLPKDPNDDRNIFLEIRAGTGGDEAAIFAGDLFRMYTKYAEQCRWKTEILNCHEGEHGGYKEIILRIEGQGAYSKLKFESGTHRVQRVPTTEAQGRIHTSTCTVAILPELDEIETFDINPTDLKIDTFRASGAGGQHVNKTESAIRITHLPTGFVVECQDERSQHKNRARAMSLLQARLLDQERSKQQQQRAEHRRLLVGTGDRSERIRTYNYPQGRLTDHRINLTLYKLPVILEGNLEDVIEPLIREYQADALAELSKD